jgi:Mg-chelatase subunit ChlD
LSTDPAELSDEDRRSLLRWRLALGPAIEKIDPGMALPMFSTASEGMAGGEVAAMDEALDFLYDPEPRAGSGPSKAYVPKWLARIREFFADDVVAMVQKDAIERKGLTQLLFEPETLPYLEPNVELVTTLMSCRGLVPDEAKEIARELVRKVVEELRRQLESEVRTAILGAVRRAEHSPLKVLRNMDWKRTIRSNLKGWDAENQRLLPERLYFWANHRRQHEWDVVMLVDQSGSMASSVVYSSVMAAIFASLNVLRTRLVVFDTEVVDLTPILTDPVEVLFTAQLGGGTDIHRAVAYGQTLIERPERTLFLVVTDLFEGGDARALVGRFRELVDSRVKAMCLLALSDGGTPSYDSGMAEQLGALGVPCFGCTPALLVRVLERVMKGQDITPVLTAGEAR